MIQFLIALLVFILIAAVAIWLIKQVPLPSPWDRVAIGLVALILLLVFLDRYALPFLDRP